MKRRRWLVAGFVILLAAAVFIGLAARHPGNTAQIQRHDPRRLTEVRQALLATIPQLRTYGRFWKLSGATSHTISADVPVLIFTDDLTVMLREEDNGVLVDVKSHSCVGKSDLGENQRHIAQLLNALEAGD
jgi:hypothetical protein